MLPNSSIEPVRPLRWRTPAQCAPLVQKLTAVWRRWEGDWATGDGHALAVRGEAATDWLASHPDEPRRWRPAQGGATPAPAPQAWWQLAATGERRIESPVRCVATAWSDGLDDQAVLAQKLAGAAWQALWAAICSALGLDGAKGEAATESGPDADRLFRPWSGAVVLTIAWREMQLHWLLPDGLVEALLQPARRGELRQPPPGPSPLVPAWEAMRSLHCVVQAELRSVELPLGEVQALQLGDVIALPHRLDHPLLARTGEGAFLCEAYLGQTGGRRAIEFLTTPMHQPSPTSGGVP